MTDASKPPLRFDVGAKVECNVGTFVRGTVIALHYRYIEQDEEPRFGYRNQGIRIERVLEWLGEQGIAL